MLGAFGTHVLNGHAAEREAFMESLKKVRIIAKPTRK